MARRNGIVRVRAQDHFDPNQPIRFRSKSHSALHNSIHTLDRHERKRQLRAAHFYDPREVQECTRLDSRKAPPQRIPRAPEPDKRNPPPAHQDW